METTKSRYLGPQEVEHKETLTPKDSPSEAKLRETFSGQDMVTYRNALTANQTCQEGPEETSGEPEAVTESEPGHKSTASKHLLGANQTV